MAVNIEVKARVTDRHQMEARIRDLAGEPVRVLRQRDTFFRAPYGRLKLRESPGNPVELIYYERDDTPGPTKSRYNRLELDEPGYFAEVLTASLGVRGVVTKQRLFYRYHHTRIHLDAVEELGDFLEIEVELDQNETTEDCLHTAHRLMESLGIKQTDLVEKAYIDLVVDQSEGQPLE